MRYFKRIAKKIFRFDYLVSNIALFLTITVLGLIGFNLSVFDPFKKALKDFNFSDLIYSQFNKNQHILDTNIVLVNIGHLNRKQIADEIKIIRKYQPKVIGFDGFFSILKEKQTDNYLKDQILRDNNFILAAYFKGYNSAYKRYDTLEKSNPFFYNAIIGHVNLGGNNPKTSTVRFFMPKEKFHNDTIYSLTARLVQVYNPDAFNSLIKRKNKTEKINYIGNYSAFTCFDTYEIFDSLTDLNIIKNKIVLMGYMGENITSANDLEDIYFTPLNSEISGRSHPDMYGMVIHANIISMILSRKYINEMPLWLTILISFIISYFYIYVISTYSKKIVHFNLIYPAILLLLNCLLIYFVFLIYKNFSYSINSAYFLAPILMYKTFDIYYARMVNFIRKHC